MVLYFSGTGNSRLVAKMLAEQTQDSCVSINRLIRKNSSEPLVSEKMPFVFVCPTYAWRIPRIVDHFIRTATFTGSRKAYFILTCGLETANAEGYIRDTCAKAGLEPAGFAEIVMPDSYLVLFPSPTQAEIDKAMAALPAQIEFLAGHIIHKQPFPDFIPHGKWKSSAAVNGLFYKLFVRDKGFHTTEKCTGCGVCAKLCSLNNIRLANSKPQWGGSCTHCMACLCACPEQAVEYKNKTKGKARYYLP